MPKITSLTTLPGVLTGAEYLTVVQDGGTYKAPLTDFPFLGFASDDIILGDSGAQNTNTIVVGANGSFQIQSGGGPDVYFTIFDDGGEDYVASLQNSGGGGLSIGVESSNLFSTEIQTNCDVLIKEYTPTGSDDVIGNEGLITKDDDFIYIKTSSGWASSPLTLLDPTP